MLKKTRMLGHSSLVCRLGRSCRLDRSCRLRTGLVVRDSVRVAERAEQELGGTGGRRASGAECVPLWRAPLVVVICRKGTRAVSEGQVRSVRSVRSVRTVSSHIR